MAQLIVISFDDVAEAHIAYDRVQELATDRALILNGIALVTSDADGKTHVETPVSGEMIGMGAAGGALFGTLIGVLFFVPFVGLVFGGAVGALFAGLDRSGIDAEFRDRVRSTVRDGKPSVVVYATDVDESALADALTSLGGAVAQTTLSDEQAKALADDFGDGGGAGRV